MNRVNDETKQVAPKLPQDILGFVGSKQCFSDILLRTISSEISDTSPVRFETLEELQSHISEHPTSMRLIVVDATQCRGNKWLCENILEILTTHRASTGLAIAYWESDLEQIIPPDTYSFPTSNGVTPFIQGFVPMNQSIDIWLSVIRLLTCGGTYFPPDFYAKPASLRGLGTQTKKDVLPSSQSGKLKATKVGPLTIRESEVMGFVVNGFQNKEIATKMKLSEHTVKLHMHHVISKLGAKNRTEAAMRFLSLKAQ